VERATATCFDSVAVTSSRESDTSLILRRVLIAHALVTGAAGVVLVSSLAAIPAAVGIRLRSDEYLLCYLLAAAEFAVAALSWLGGRLTDSQGIRAIVWSFVVLHATSGLLEAVVFVERPATALSVNVVARAIIVALFRRLLPSHGNRDCLRRSLALSRLGPELRHTSRRLWQSRATENRMNAPKGGTTATLQIPAFVVVWLVVEYIVVGRLALAFIPLFIGGFTVWWFTTYRGSD
jgi:hypothetical protein